MAHQNKLKQKLVEAFNRHNKIKCNKYVRV